MVWFRPCILLFSLDTIIDMTLKYTQEIFLLYFSGINRTFARKSTWVLFLGSSVCYKFYNDKWKTHYSFQGCSIITWLITFLLIFINWNATSSYLIFSWKLRDLKEFSRIRWCPLKKQIWRSPNGAIWN